MIGVVGSSVNFTWSFSGGLDGVVWAIMPPGSYHIQDDKRLVFLDNDGNSLIIPVLAEYIGRVSGSRSGNASSGQIIFTLSNIKNTDEKRYGWRFSPTYIWDPRPVDSVLFIVYGKPVFLHYAKNRELISL